MNVRDSQIIEMMLRRRGFSVAGEAEDADVILFNTCSVREHAEERVFNNLMALRRLKEGSPAKIFGLVGCMAERHKEKIFEQLPHIDFTAGPQNIYDIPDIIDEIERGFSRIVRVGAEQRPDRVDSFDVKPQDNDGIFVSIMEGCDNFCSYCIVPYVRGRERSRRPEHIIEEIERLIANGRRDITLLGQNVNSYGKGLADKMEFVDLLEKIDIIDGLASVQFVTSHPKDAGERLFHAMAELNKVAKSIHLPVQSGSDRILKLMNRGYTAADYIKKITQLRKLIPDVRITTDIIVGFPTEMEEDYDCTRDLMKGLEFAGAYIFKYSPRPPSASCELPDDVPQEEKERRNLELLELQKEISRKSK